MHGRGLRLSFGTVVNGPTHDGVRMSVLVGGQELWSETQAQANRPAAHSLDLRAFAGQTIALTLRVDALGDNTGDWSNWLQPVILIELAKGGTKP